MKYWEINEEHRIVALFDELVVGVKIGDTGGVIPDSCDLPSEEEPLWVGKTASIGDGVSIGGWVIIDESVVIGDFSKILSHTTTDEGSVIGEYSEIGKGSSISKESFIGSDSIIGWNVRLCERAKVYARVII